MRYVQVVVDSYRQGFRDRFGRECILDNEVVMRLAHQFANAPSAKLDDDPVLSAMADAEG